MYRILAILSAFFYINNTYSQDMGIHFGHQMFGVFNAKQPLHGISIGLDIPRTGFITPYGQLSIFAPYRSEFRTIGSGVPNNAADPFIFDVQGRTRTMTYSLEFGTIYYLGGAYDYGFAAMVHNSIRILMMPTKTELVDFDFDNYVFEPINPNAALSNSTGFVLNTSAGLGIKYTFEWGSLYALGGLELALFGDRLPDYYYDELGRVSPISFSTRIGVRRELDFSKSSERKKIRENNRKEKQKW